MIKNALEITMEKQNRQPHMAEGLTLVQASAIIAAANRGVSAEAKRRMETAGKAWQDAMQRAVSVTDQAVVAMRKYATTSQDAGRALQAVAKFYVDAADPNVVNGEKK